jgi:hypothetical protein
MSLDLMLGFGSFTPSSPGLTGAESDGTNILTGGTGMTADWTTEAATLTTAVTTAPDGTTTAALLTESSADARHIVYQTVTQDSSCTFSVYAKANGRRYLQVVIGTPNGQSHVYADLQNGIITETGVAGTGVNTSSTIEVGANGFWKITNVGYGEPDNVINYYVLALSNRSTQTGTTFLGNPQYTGDGTSGIYLWRPKVVA